MSSIYPQNWCRVPFVAHDQIVLFPFFGIKNKSDSLWYENQLCQSLWYKKQLR
jgi:hypothetical protein